jgi:cell division protein FtsB
MKNNNLLDKITWDFIKLNEDISPSVFSYLQSLSETLGKIRPSSTTDGRRIEIAKSHLKEVKKHVNKLEEQVYNLEEKVKLLEETKNKDIVKEE